VEVGARTITEASMTELSTWLTTFGVCVVSALVPFVNAEVYLIAASALLPSTHAVALIVAATFGQMFGKVFMYYAGRGVVRLPGERFQRMLARAESRLSARPGAQGLVIFSSATLGLPPFYLVSIAAGMLKVGLAWFLLLGLGGRFLRFAVVVLLPQVARAGWPL
jgi:membrane protein YqaA with SNARE-associated domain